MSIKSEEYMSIHLLRSKNNSIRNIAKELQLSTTTVQKYLKTDFVKSPKKDKAPNPFDELIKKYLAMNSRIPSSVILEKLKPLGYNKSLRTLQRYIKPLRPKKNKPSFICRFETEPGYQAQADWTVLRNGKKPIYAFVMVLGYSRTAFVYITDNMKQETWQECHLKAFSYFGGVPQTILYDNLKSVVIQRNKYANYEHEYNAEFMAFAKGLFIPKLCKPSRPQTKGKVERFNDYLKNNFCNTLSEDDFSVEVLNIKVLKWLNNVANVRIHRTTNKRPFDMLKDEINYLYKGHELLAKKQSIKLSQDFCGTQRLKSTKSIKVFHDSTLYEKVLGAHL